MSAPDISAEAVENIAIRHALNGRPETAATLRALRAALDAAEGRAARIEAAWQEDGGRYWEARYRDEAALNENLAAINEKMKAERDAADATGYARGVRDAAGLAQRLKAQPCISGKCTCWPTCEARKTDASLAEIAAAILALLPATDAPKETRDDQ